MGGQFLMMMIMMVGSERGERWAMVGLLNHKCRHFPRTTVKNIVDCSKWNNGACIGH